MRIFTKHEIDAMESIQPNIMECEEFEELLMGYRENAFKIRHSCMMSKQFRDDFSGLESEVKESTLSHIFVINRSKRPNLFGSVFTFKHAAHNIKPIKKNFDLDALGENDAYNVVDVGRGHRMVFEYDHYRKIIKYLTIEKTQESDNEPLIMLPNTDDWNSADGEWVRDHLKYLEQNSFTKHGFQSAAEMSKQISL